MEAPHRGGGVLLGGLWSGTSGSLRVSGYDARSTLVLPHTPSSLGAGRCGMDLAEATSVHLSPDTSAPRSSGEGPPGWIIILLVEPYWPCLLVLGPGVSPRRLSLGDSSQEGPSVSSGLGDLSPSPEILDPVGLASEGAQLIDFGLSTEVVETILHSRAPSTRKLYVLSDGFSLHIAVSDSVAQFTARLVQCWSYCWLIFPQGYPLPH